MSDEISGIIDELSKTGCVSFYDLHREPEEVARNLNMQVVYPQNNQLQVDIDDEESYKLFCERFDNLSPFFGKENINIVDTPSKSGLPKRHITITVSNWYFTEVNRLLLQVLLGSDSNREWLGCLRVLDIGKSKTCFFEKGDTPSE